MMFVMRIVYAIAKFSWYKMKKQGNCYLFHTKKSEEIKVYNPDKY